MIPWGMRFPLPPLVPARAVRIAPPLRRDHVEHRGGKWVVLSRDRSKILGTYATKTEANERLRQIEAAKAAKG